MAACRRSRRRLRRPADERRGGRGASSRGVRCRCSSAAASATCDRRGLARPGRAPRDHRHRRGARSRLRARGGAALHPGRIAVGIDARDGLVAVEGWAAGLELSGRRARPPLRGRRRRRDRLHRHRPRRRAQGPQHRGDAGARRRRLASRSSPRAASPRIDDVERLLQPDCAVLEGAITGRALYDGRLDPARSARR